MAGFDGLPAASDPSVLTPEVILATVALVLTIALWLVDRVWIRRGKVTYRVHLDAPVDITPHDEASEFELEVIDKGRPVEGATIALVRIRNQGGGHVDDHDIIAPIKLTFPRREVFNVRVVAAVPASLKDVVADAGIEHTTSSVVLPKVALNRGDSYKVLVLLGGPGRGVEGEAYIKGADFAYDPGTIAPSRRTLALGAAAVLFSGLLGGLVWNQLRVPPPLCPDGTLDIEGSTAFAPLMEDIVARYEEACPNAEIALDANGSREGLRNLVEEVQRDPAAAGRLLVMSDVEVGNLQPTPVGRLVFAFVINEEIGLTDLTTEQLRDLYAGEYTSWSQLGGSDTPIVLVGRDAQSGTRAVVGEALDLTEEAFNSDACTPAQGAALPVRCERRDTEQVLREVDDNAGTLGYAQPSAVEDYDRVVQVSIDGEPPSLGTPYPLWATEHLYTFGNPDRGSLLDTFLLYAEEYLGTPEARQRLREGGFEPLSGGG